jgi:hypothetical protein
MLYSREEQLKELSKQKRDHLSMRDQRTLRELHIPKALNINDTFKFEKEAVPQHKLLVPKILLQSTKTKEDLSRAFNSQYPHIGAALGFATVKSLTESARLAEEENIGGFGADGV